MSHLPPELVFIVLEHAYYMSDGSPNCYLLANCSLVCSSWSKPAQTLLFRKIYLSRLKTITKFYAALMTSAVRGKPMGHVVRSLEIFITGSDDGSCRPETFARLLAACPKLYELSLNTFDLHEFDPFTLAILKDSGQGIRALNVRSGNKHSLVLFQLLGIWHRIKFLLVGVDVWPCGHPSETLVLGQSPANGGLYDVARHIPLHVALYELKLACILQDSCLTWLLGSSASSLRILDLYLHGTSVPQFLDVHTPHLRSLRLYDISLEWAAFLRKCTQLEELVIYGIHFVPFPPNLPPSIEHLCFENPDFTNYNTPRSILEVTEVLPKLRVVTCPVDAEGLEDFEALKRRCAERGIDVVVSEISYLVSCILGARL